MRDLRIMHFSNVTSNITLERVKSSKILHGPVRNEVSYGVIKSCVVGKPI